MGIISGGGGGGGASFTPVGCVLGLNTLDVAAGGSHIMNWNSLTDNTFDGNPLGALPAGIGFTVAFDGSDGIATFTTDGVWAFTLSFGYHTNDATWAGVCASQFGGNLLIPIASGVSSGETGGSDIIQAATSDSLAFRVITSAVATTAANLSDMALEVVRLA